MAADHGPGVGTVEIVCGVLLLIGLLTRLATIPLLGVILVAIATTKIPMIGKTGMWSMLHEARADFSILLGLIFLLDLRAPGRCPWMPRRRRSILRPHVLGTTTKRWKKLSCFHRGRCGSLADLRSARPLRCPRTRLRRACPTGCESSDGA